MAAEDPNTPVPIYVKRVINVGHGGHSSAWKVALADFMTAMMAFFMVMWLLASTTTEERKIISEYFSDPNSDEGLLSKQEAVAPTGNTGTSDSVIEFSGGALQMAKKNTPPDNMPVKDLAQLEEAQRQIMEQLKDDLEDIIVASQALEPFKDQLLLDITPEGLRIQIVDKKNRPMFDLGKARLKGYAKMILRGIAPVINNVPNKISISGHTDSKVFFGRTTYSNWELSVDRANAARREMLWGGYSGSKIQQVVGLADVAPFVKGDLENPTNRRINILILNKQTEEKMKREVMGHLNLPE